jgi:hypothetical protein
MANVPPFRLTLCASAFLLSGCTLESFEVEPCLLNGRVAFRIHEIDGWLSDYQPRPMSVLVLESSGPRSKFPGVWSAEFKYYSDRDNGFDSRPARKLMVYGQRLPGWDVSQTAEPLRHAERYEIVIRDSGHNGYADFSLREPLPTCS